MTPNYSHILIGRSLFVDHNDQGGQTEKTQKLLKISEMRSLGEA